MTLRLPAFSAVILAVAVTPLIPHLLAAAGGDVRAAQDEAIALIAEYEPVTREELRLASQAIGFGLQAGAALWEAGQPGQPEATILALRRMAAVMQRSELSARRLLTALRRQRDQAANTVDAGPPSTLEKENHPISPEVARAGQPGTAQPVQQPAFKTALRPLGLRPASPTLKRCDAGPRIRAAACDHTSRGLVARTEPSAASDKVAA